ncbi:MAG: ACT domain-containing protein [Acidimicrobiales bacterium]|nr:ACT domain-containing protein [Acidimicrobiales bacterium]
MESYVLRVWLPDRPGALGAVASRIGAVKGDVVGIEILETGAGQAVDELVVNIPDATVIDLLVNEVVQVDGVKVEEVRPSGSEEHDPRLAGLEAAAALVEAADRSDLLTAVDEFAPRSLAASWVAVVDLTNGSLLRSSGADAPSPEWLAAFVVGAESGGGAATDVAWVALPGSRLGLVAGRERIAWRDRERRHLDTLARILDKRWQELS